MQDLWQALPDPIKAASVVIFLGLLTAIGLAFSLIFWQFVHPSTAEKLKSLLVGDDIGPRS